MFEFCFLEVQFFVRKNIQVRGVLTKIEANMQGKGIYRERDSRMQVNGALCLSACRSIKNCSRTLFFVIDLMII